MAKKKILVVFYSRTGTTRKVGLEMAKKLNSDVEEIVDKKNRKGAMGYIRSVRDAMRKRLTDLEKIEANLADYDLVVVGTPIWAWNVSGPVRTFLVQNCNWIQKTAYFCTMGGAGDEKAFTEMAKICDKDPIATLSLRTKDVKADGYEERLDAFVSALKKWVK